MVVKYIELIASNLLARSKLLELTHIETFSFSAVSTTNDD